MSYFIWIPALIVLTALWAWMAKQVNINPASPFFYFLFISIPVWGFVCRSSKNLLFDSTIYDIIMSLAYAGAFIAFGYGQSFTSIQWTGLIIAIFGICLMKVQI